MGGEGKPDRLGEKTRERTRTGARGRMRWREYQSRGWSLETAAREFVWLWDHRHGSSLGEIANRAGVSVSRLRFGLTRAAAQEKAPPNPLQAPTKGGPRPPKLVPLFPIGPYTPSSPCGHKRPIRVGSVLCCMVCHESGMDSHPALIRDPRTDPKPEPKTPIARVDPSPAAETRKQKRKRLSIVRTSENP